VKGAGVTQSSVDGPEASPFDGVPQPGDGEAARARVQADATIHPAADWYSAPTRVDHDHALVEALRLREPTAAERLVDTYGDRAYRLASRITGVPQDAEEVVQDALLTIVRKIETFRGEAAFGSWLYRIVANAAYQKIRSRPERRGGLSLDALSGVIDERARGAERGVDWAAFVDDPARRSELRIALTAAIDELSPEYRAVIVLRDVEGLSPAEIGEAMDLSVANVKTRIHRARLFLRKRLAKSLARSSHA
jgi:RNA polymerase sigma-70 factor (ECF subfamily)